MKESGVKQKGIRGMCGYHRAQVARSPALAMGYWQRSMALAGQAVAEGNQGLAVRAFACAFDIAQLRLADSRRGLLSGFGEAQLVDAACGWLALTQSRQGVPSTNLPEQAVDDAREALWITLRCLRGQLSRPNSLARYREVHQLLVRVEKYLPLLTQASGNLALPEARAVTLGREVFPVLQ